jgi:hypothetical protein
MSSKSKEAQDILIDGLKITPEIVEVLKEIKDHKGPEIKEFFTEQCLIIAAMDSYKTGIDLSLFEVFLDFHHLLKALFQEEGGTHEKN